MAERAPIELKAGKLYMFSEGDYSDYCIQGTFVALRDVPASEVSAIADYLISQEPSVPGRASDAYYRERDAADKVLATLIRAGILLEVDHEEITLDDFIDMHSGNGG